MNMIFKASLLLTTLLVLCLRVAQSSDDDGSTLSTELPDLSDGSKIEEYILNNLDIPDHNVQKRQIPCGSSTANMNSYIDTVLSNARGTIRSKADPLRLSDAKKVVKFYDGKVTGLSSIRRTGNVQLGCTSSTITLSANLGFSRVTASYRWKKRVLFLKKKGRVSISVKSLNVYIRLSQKLNSNAKPVLNDLKVKVSGIRVKIHGLSIFGHVLGAAVSLISGIFRKAISHAIEKPIKKAIQGQLNKVKIPL